MSLIEVLDEAARLHPTRKAVIFQNLTWTYAQLRDKAEALAASLRMRGINPGDRVAIMLPNIPQTIVALWGVFKAGAVAVMTNPLYMEKELTHHFADSQARVLITLDLLWPKIAPLWSRLGLDWCVVTRIADGLSFPLNILQPWKAKRQGQAPVVGYDGKTILRWSDFLRTKNRFSAVIDDPAHSLALLQYTGGTTGVSKAAMLSHQNLASQMQILQQVIGGDASTKRYIFLSIMPFFHVFGLVGNIILPALYAGASIPVPRYTPADLLKTIQKYRPNFFIGAPSVYMSLMQQKDITKYDLTCIELCISGSAPFPKEAMVRFQEMTGANITEGLGLTEASPVVSANPLYGLQKTGSVGTPVPGTELRIMDIETGTRVLGDNEPGELVVRGPQVMLGYWNRPEETAATLRDGWLYTGDIAYRDSDGYYFIVDRKKDMAIVGGYNVYPHEVDEVLYEHPKVAEAVAVSVPHRTRGETLKAYIVTKPGETLTVAELVTHCRSKLANYKVPKLFEFREELPKTLVGKVLRRVLREEEECKLRDKASELMDKTRVKAAELAGRAAELADAAKGKADELSGIAKDKAAELAGRAAELADAAKDKADEISGIARDKAADLADKTRDKAAELAGKMDELKEQAGKFMDKTLRPAEAADACPESAAAPADASASALPPEESTHAQPTEETPAAAREAVPASPRDAGEPENPAQNPSQITPA